MYNDNLKKKCSSLEQLANFSDGDLKFVHKRGHALFQVETIMKYGKYTNKSKNLLLQNQWANFNQT